MKSNLYEIKAILNLAKDLLKDRKDFFNLISWITMLISHYCLYVKNILFFSRPICKKADNIYNSLL